MYRNYRRKYNIRYCQPSASSSSCHVLPPTCFLLPSPTPRSITRNTYGAPKNQPTSSKHPAGRLVLIMLDSHAFARFCVRVHMENARTRHTSWLEMESPARASTQGSISNAQWRYAKVYILKEVKLNKDGTRACEYMYVLYNGFIYSSMFYDSSFHHILFVQYLKHCHVVQTAYLLVKIIKERWYGCAKCNMFLLPLHITYYMYIIKCSLSLLQAFCVWLYCCWNYFEFCVVGTATQNLVEETLKWWIIR